MKAIVVKYLPPTNTKGARLKASANGVAALVCSYPYDSRQAHAYAALALCKRHGWHGTLVSGGLPDGSSEVFCFLHSEHCPIPEETK